MLSGARAGGTKAVRVGEELVRIRMRSSDWLLLACSRVGRAPFDPTGILFASTRCDTLRLD